MQYKDRPLFPSTPPFDPEKRAQAIREAIAKKRIKRTEQIDEILALLDEMVALEEKTA